MTKDLLQRHRSLRILVGLIIVALFFYVVGVVWSVLVVFGDVIVMFLLAWIIAFILEPVSIFLQRRGHLHRIAAVSVIYTAFLIVVSGAIVLAIPALEGETQHIAAEITTAFSPGNISSLNGTAVNFLIHLGLNEQSAHQAVERASAQLPAFTQNFANSAVSTATSLLTSLLNIIFDASLILIISFYMMLDGGRLVEALVVRLPPAWVPDVRLFQRNVDQIFGGFFRAQLIVAGIYIAFTWLILFALGQPNGLLVAILGGILMLLPFIGVFLAIIPPALLVLIQTPPNQLAIKLLLLVVLLAAAQHLVINLLGPRIFGAHMGVPTLVLFAALLLGAKEGGVWGAFFAGPVIGVGYAMFEVFYERYTTNSTLYNNKPLDETGISTIPPPEGLAQDTSGTFVVTAKPSERHGISRYLPLPKSRKHGSEHDEKATAAEQDVAPTSEREPTASSASASLPDEG